jgi:chromosome partitioning protein
VIRVAIVNTKGGSGKTTLTVSLASWLAARGKRVAIVDYDPQGSSLAWLARRPATAPKIIGVKAHDIDFRINRSYRLVDGQEVSYLLMDTPAAIARQNLIYFCRDAHRVLVPVLPSAIDTHACARLIQNLLLNGGLRHDQARLAVVASRTRHNTLAYTALQRFLATMNLPIIATVRDSQNYVKSAELGLGVPEMPVKLVEKDLSTWNTLGEWLESVPTDVQAFQESKRPTSVAGTFRAAGVVGAANQGSFVKEPVAIPAMLRAE